MAIKNIVFDLGNVLVDYKWEAYLRSFGFAEETFHAVANAMFCNEDWEEGDKGSVTPDEWLSLFIENAPGYEKEIREVYDKLGGCIARFPYTDALIHSYRMKGMRIFYLSNYSEYLYEKTKSQLSFIEDFDGGVFSFREKCVKPVETIYKILLKRYDIDAGETLFYDDRPENIEAANQLGIHGVLFTPDRIKDLN